MLRRFFCVGLLFVSCAAQAAAVSGPTKATPSKSGTPQCAQDLASVDRSFADAMRDLQKTGASDARCTSWRRQIDVMKKASDVFARCTVDEARATNMSQMEGSIADFRAMIEDAKCP